VRKILITSMTAIGLSAFPAMAQDVTGTIGAGTSASTPDGSVASGVSAGARIEDDDRDGRKEDRRRGRRSDREQPADEVNSATTHGAGTVYTDRDRATGGVTAGGTATGTGDQNASSTVNAYGATDDTGSVGEVYGDASASSTSSGDDDR
jgi:hypothetical protein